MTGDGARVTTSSTLTTAPDAAAVPPPRASDDDVRWYALGADEVAHRLGTDTASGLSAADAQDRQHRYGANALPLEKPPSPLVRFAKE